jgi:predicted nucleic acid-binding protein
MFVAVDTNVILDLALPKDVTHDAIELLRRRVKGVEVIVPPTVLEELSYIATHGTPADKRLAITALQKLVHEWKFRPMDFIPVGHGITEAIAVKLRKRGIVPTAEVNDSLIVAEAALANCTILLSSDKHLSEADAVAMTRVLKECDVEPVLVQTPAILVRKFFASVRKR